jgi:accessory gene regulator B
MRSKWLYKHISVIPNINSYDFVKRLPDKLLKHLQNIHELSKEKPYKLKYLYYYGFQIIYGSINKGLLLILLGLLFNILPQLLLISLSFASVRIFAGGLHFDSYTKCAYISLITFVLMGLLAKIFT